MKLRMAMIFAKDLNRMLAFYRDGLGLTPVPDQCGEGWAVFDAGGARVALHAVPPAIARNIEIAEPPQARSETPIKLVFHTEDLEAVALRLAGLGAKLFPPRVSGSRDVVDPEGNIFQLAGDEP
jgi:predicted enzyme related to lactoylglutathione lyase